MEELAALEAAVERTFDYVKYQPEGIAWRSFRWLQRRRDAVALALLGLEVMW
jgi:hypothetical protein